MRVVLDANFLMIPGQFGVDIFAELNRVLEDKRELVVPDSVVQELKMLSTGASKDSRAAKMGLELIERKSVRVIVMQNKKADGAIEELASEGRTVVATQDKELQNTLRKKKVPLVILSGNKLVPEGFV